MPVLLKISDAVAQVVLLFRFNEDFAQAPRLACVHAAIVGRMSERAERLVWLDMEMTGLDPEVCVPIEVAVIVTEGSLREVEGAQYEAVISQPEEALALMPPVVVEMHTVNGLIQRVRESTRAIEEVDAALAELVKEHCLDGKALLAGNTIQQDRRFIRRYFPLLEKTLHYRQLDVSSFKEAIRRRYGAKAVFAKETSHTAMADIRHSIEEMAYYQDKYFRSVEEIGA